MANSDVVCPKCGQLMIHRHAEGEWQFYDCPMHGTVVLPRDTPRDPAAPERRATPERPAHADNVVLPDNAADPRDRRPAGRDAPRDERER